MAQNVRVLGPGDLPPEFHNLDPACRELYVAGELPPARLPRVAMVGSRSPSAGGRQVAYEIARELARAGVVVVSGLARGIDSAAHRGALDGGGPTVAFLGCGVDVVYPASSRELSREILGNGALVSEYPPGWAPQPYRFVHRNRLVAAYTRGTLVVEAGARSGALITAGMAAERGRELWAVPGDPRRPGCLGNNRLLRDGAGVVIDGLDVLASLGLLQAAGEAGNPVWTPPGLTPVEEKVWKTVVREGTADPETVSRRTGVPVSELLTALSMLELGGYLRREGEGYLPVTPAKPRGPVF